MGAVGYGGAAIGSRRTLWLWGKRGGGEASGNKSLWWARSARHNAFGLAHVFFHQRPRPMTPCANNNQSLYALANWHPRKHRNSRLMTNITMLQPSASLCASKTGPQCTKGSQPCRGCAPCRGLRLKTHPCGNSHRQARAPRLSS